MDGFTLLQSLVDRYYVSQLTGEPKYNWRYRVNINLHDFVLTVIFYYVTAIAFIYSIMI